MTAAAESQKRRVFLVDDHPLVRDWLANLINQQPDLTVCGEAATAVEAIQKIGNAQADVAVVDISLKDSSGIELIKDLKRVCANLLILIFSMHDESLYAERALRAGAKGYVIKREATTRVIEAIRRVLEGQLCLTDALAQTLTTQVVEGKTFAVHSTLAQLSDRQLAVFDLLGQGLGTRRIAERLGISIKTVQAHCSRMKQKLHLYNARQLVRAAIRHQETQSDHLK
jgi:DNA-binding NarL/FixJ family response regulator